MLKNQMRSFFAQGAAALGLLSLLLFMGLPAMADEKSETYIKSKTEAEASNSEWSFTWTYFQIPLGRDLPPGYYGEFVVEYGYRIVPWAEMIAIVLANQPFTGKNKGSPSYGLGDTEFGFEFDLVETRKMSVIANVMTMFPTSQDSRDTSYQGSLDGGIEWRWFPGRQKVFSFGTNHQVWFNSYDRPTTEEHGGDPNYESDLYNKIVFILKPNNHLILSQNFGYHIHQSVDGDTYYTQSTRSKVSIPINSGLSFFSSITWEDEVGSEKGYFNEETTTLGMGLGALF